MSGLLTEDEFFYTFPQIGELPDGTKDPSFDTNVQGVVVAIYEIGALIGSLLVLWKGDAVGREFEMRLLPLHNASEDLG